MPDARLLPGVTRGHAFMVELDGHPTEAYAGETVAALILRRGGHGTVNGIYVCGMGACFQCVVDVDGRTVQACLTCVAPAMRITCRT